MIDQSNTLAFYNTNANSFIEQTINVNTHLLYQPFIDNLPVRTANQQDILELGCGSGRDSMHFANLGFNVTAIWACASLLHVRYTELHELIEALLDMLADDGVFYASFKYGGSERLKDGRFFCDMNEERWKALKQKFTYEFKDKTWLTTDQRRDRNEKWFNIIIKR